MFYRVILDCRPTLASASQPFITIKFVEADSEADAIELATNRTKALMIEKGFEPSAIGTFDFTTDEIEMFDPDEAIFEAERSFIFYSDS